MSYSELKTDGFLFQRTSTAFNILRPGFGDGYDDALVIGDELRKWSIKITALPDLAIKPVSGKTRAAYLWDFFLASKNAGDQPFWILDPKDGLFYLASFSAEALSFEILRAKVYATGLELSQRRTFDQVTPVAAIPS